MPDDDENGPQPPDFAAEGLQELRQQLMNGFDATEDEIIQQLNELWRDGRMRRNQQGVRRPDDEAEQHQHEDEQQQPDPQPINPVGKRRAVLIHDGLMVTDKRVPDPSEYALRKLQNHEFVELWYFSSRGCVEAAQSSLSFDTDTLSLTTTNNTLELQLVRAVSHAKGVIPDQNLSWAEMTAAKNNMLSHMAKCGWNQDTVKKFLEFYVALDLHPSRGDDENADKILLIYQAEVRRDWHQAVSRASKDQRVFDISAINETRLRAISEEYFRKQRNRTLAE